MIGTAVKRLASRPHSSLWCGPEDIRHEDHVSMTTPPSPPHDLDTLYDQAKWAANMQEVIGRYGLLSDATRAAIGEPLRLSYGPADVERLDLYKARQNGAPIAVFVHGGGWRGGSAREYAFPAEMLVKAGIHFVTLDFSSVVAANGSLAVLVDQVRRALQFVFQNCADMGGDPKRIYLAGHSSGAHLAGMALSTDWASRGAPAEPIKAGLLVSGIYDLGPVRQTSRSAYVSIDDAAERDLSPIHQVERLRAPVLLAVGSTESPAFQQQAQAYADAATRSGKRMTLVRAESYNHFEILETLGNPYGLLGRHLLELIGANGG